MEQPASDGATLRLYDTDDDHRTDYGELLSSAGKVTVLRYDTDEDNTLDYEISLDQIPEKEIRHLVILLDSVPYEMVDDLWRHGRFRLFNAPSRVIPPFPVMTDLSFAEFFGVSPSPGVESYYYDGRRLVGGLNNYLGLSNSRWLDHVDYAMSFDAHLPTYLWPHPWLDHELRRIAELRRRRDDPTIIGYCVGTSAVGARKGRNGHQEALVRLDRFCQALVHDSRGRIRITLLSDHGHALAPSRRISLDESLERFGYRVVDHLKGPADVVVAEFGMVTCASLYTRSPRAVAGDVVGIEGVDLAMYRDTDDTVVVLSRDGQARIARHDSAYRYEAEYGDPLRLLPIVESLSRSGQVGHDGFIADDALFEATWDHVYPDAVHRCWRAFHGLVEHTPVVLLSIKDGWHCGSESLSSLYGLQASHGSLGQTSSTAFVMSMTASLPKAIRMEDLRAALSLP